MTRWLRQLPADRWLAVGGAFTGLGGIAAVTYWIYVDTAKGRNFWTVPGYASLAVFVIGLLALTTGFFYPPDPPRRGGSQQHQRGGDQSTNVQIGRDLHIRRDRD